MLSHAFVGLILFFVLFAAASWTVRWLQRRSGGALGRAFGGSGDVRVIRRSPLSWHCSCVVVDIAGKQFAVALSRRGAITLLGEVSLPMDAMKARAAPVPQAATFADAVRRALTRRGERS